MLHDLTVLDLTDAFGAMCGQLLTELGARVTHWLDEQTAAELPNSAFWRAYTEGKQVAVVDWRRQPERVLAVVADADVLIESEPPGLLASLGLSWQRLQEINPRLIQVSITGFGSDGPKAHYDYTDLIAVAASGHLYLSGDAARAPVRISEPQAHAHASADAAVGILIALADRDRTGLGQWLDISAQQSTTLANLSRSLDGAVGQPAAMRSAYASRIGEVLVRTQFEASDGPVLVLQGVLPPLAGFMARLMDWVVEEGYAPATVLTMDWAGAGADMAARRLSAADWLPVEAGISQLMASRTRAELMEEAVARRLLIAPVFDVADLLLSHQAAYRELVRKGSDGAKLGPFAHFALAEPTAGTTVARRAVPPLPTAVPGAALPLAGVKILDLFWVVAGPGATRMLADYGATVVHVESRRRVDMVRNVPPYIGGQRDLERASCHHTTNANKLNLSLDLSTDAGRAVLADLVRWAEVITESFAPGVLARMGFDEVRIRELNPNVIFVSSCLMGQTGPWRDYAGYGNTAAAVSGFHGLTGHADASPTGCFGPYTDFTSVRFNALAILAALRHRSQTGQGQTIDMSQAEAALRFLAPACYAFLHDLPRRERQGNRDPDMAPHGLFPTRGEDRWIAIAIVDDEHWRRLVAFLDLPQAWTDYSLAQRQRAATEIEAAIAARTVLLDGQQLETDLQTRRIAAHRVLDTAELYLDPQLSARDHFIPVAHTACSGARVESSRLKFSRTRPRRPEVAPHFGIDNRQVLGDLLGYPAARIDELDASGVLT